MWKTLSLAMLAALAPLSAFSETAIYRLTMSLKIPRVYNNTQSLGCRRNQTQKIVACLYVDKDDLEDGEPAMEIEGCYNKTHKVAGANVTYKDAKASGVMWRYIGSNKTRVFKNANVRFCLDLDPSYNIGADEPDNTLIITLSGYGSTERHIRGQVTGQIGCGCSAYGHMSPTRTIDCRVSDIVPICGQFSMRRVSLSALCR